MIETIFGATILIIWFCGAVLWDRCRPLDWILDSDAAGPVFAIVSLGGAAYFAVKPFIT